MMRSKAWLLNAFIAAVSLAAIGLALTSLWQSWQSLRASQSLPKAAAPVPSNQVPGYPWDLSDSDVPVEEVHSGGPPPDGIPGLGIPGRLLKFVRADKATFLKDDEQVIGVEINGEAKAYPIKILHYHECINDTCGGEPIAATW